MQTNILAIIYNSNHIQTKFCTTNIWFVSWIRFFSKGICNKTNMKLHKIKNRWLDSNLFKIHNVSVNDMEHWIYNYNVNYNIHVLISLWCQCTTGKSNTNIPDSILHKSFKNTILYQLIHWENVLWHDNQFCYLVANWKGCF